MTPEELVSNYPVLHHMAEQDSWPRIRQLGLRTTEQLVDACGPDADLRTEILTRRRRVSYELSHPVVGTITVRDQKPLMLHNLEPALSDMTVGEFLTLLNDRVFMWTHPSRLTKLLGATAYRDSAHEVLVIDTAPLVETYADSIRLTGMNTGATIFPNSPARGAESFMPISDFPFQARRKSRTLPNNVVELCVIGGVDDIEDYVLRVERRQGAEVVETIYTG